MSVKITKVSTICTAPQGINLVAVRVDTNQPGLYGLGCATFAYRHLAVKLVVEEYLDPLLRGRDATAIEEIWQLMHQNAYWRNGPIENNAISGVDMALWDIKGKLANMPLYQLFGGKCREAVPVYRHASGRTLPELLDKIEEFRSGGARYIRCNCLEYGGTGYGDAPAFAPEGAQKGLYMDNGDMIRKTVDMYAAIRERFGYDLKLIHDVHERISPQEAIRLAKLLEPYDLFFLEDPVSLEDMEWLREMRRQTSIPISIGELLGNPAEWKNLIAERAFDYVRVHITMIGGITPARKLQIFAEQYGVKIAWHGPGDMTPIGHAANIHIDLAAQNLGIQEWSGTQPPNIQLYDITGPQNALLDVFEGMPEYKNGYVYANDKPGLGIDINEKEAAKYPCSADVVTWTQTRKMDGSLQTP